MLAGNAWPLTVNLKGFESLAPNYPAELYAQLKKRAKKIEVNENPEITDTASVHDVPAPTKRQRSEATTVRTPAWHVSVADLAGNGMSLADVGTVLQAVVLSLNAGIWEYDGVRGLRDADHAEPHVDVAPEWVRSSV